MCLFLSLCLVAICEQNVRRERESGLTRNHPITKKYMFVWGFPRARKCLEEMDYCGSEETGFLRLCKKNEIRFCNFANSKQGEESNKLLSTAEQRRHTHARERS